MNQIIEHKRGASFARRGLKALPAGNWVAQCEARDSFGMLVQTFAVDIAAPVDPETRHMVTITASHADTNKWPVTQLSCDVAFVDGTVSPVLEIPTDTFIIDVVAEATHVG